VIIIIAADAQKYFALTNVAMTRAAHDEHKADLQAQHDEELLIQATIEYDKNETKIAKYLTEQVSDEAKNNIVFYTNKNTFSLTPKYYDVLYSNYNNSTQEVQYNIDRAELSDGYSRQAIIITSFLAMTIVIFSELTRKKEK